MKPEDIPKIGEIKKSIERLKLKKFPTFKDHLKVEEFVKHINDELLNEFGFMLNPIHILNCKKSFISFFRVRPLDDFINIDLIGEHSYPPLNSVKMNRCNFPGFPVFYCSNNAGTALMEVVKNIKDKNKEFCIAKWQVIESNENFHFESFLQIPLPEENQFSFFNDNYSEKFNSAFRKSFNSDLTEEQKEGINEYLKYIASCFIQDYEYSISASLAHRTLYANHNFRTDIIIYPSVQSSFKGVNFALHPNFVENNLKLVRLYVCNFSEFDSLKNLIKISTTKYAEVEKNVIVWRNIHPENIEYENFINDDFGEVINSEYIRQ